LRWEDAACHLGIRKGIDRFLYQSGISFIIEVYKKNCRWVSAESGAVAALSAPITTNANSLYDIGFHSLVGWWHELAAQEFEGWSWGMRADPALDQIGGRSVAQPTGSIRWPAGAARDQGGLPVLDNPAVEWREILSPYHPDGGTDGRSAGWSCAFKTRPKRISRRNRDGRLGRLQLRGPAWAVRASDPGG